MTSSDAVYSGTFYDLVKDRQCVFFAPTDDLVFSIENMIDYFSEHSGGEKNVWRIGGFVSDYSSVSTDKAVVFLDGEEYSDFEAVKIATGFGEGSTVFGVHIVDEYGRLPDFRLETPEDMLSKLSKLFCSCFEVQPVPLVEKVDKEEADARLSFYSDQEWSYWPSFANSFIEFSSALDEPKENVAPGLCRISDGDGLFYQGKTNTLVGAPASGKSWTVLYACKQEIEDKKHVLFIDLESDARTTFRRLIQLGCSKENVSIYFHYLNPLSALGGEVESLLFWVQKMHPTLVVIDSESKAMSRDNIDPDSESDTIRWFESVPLAFSRLGSCVVVVDHTTKTNSGSLFASGSKSKLTSVDGAQYVQEIKKEFSKRDAGEAVLRCAKDRNGFFTARTIVARMLVVPNGDYVGIEMVPEIDNPEEAKHPIEGVDSKDVVVMKKISSLLEKRESDNLPPVSQNFIYNAVGGKKSRLIVLLDKMVDAGYISMTIEKNSKLHSFVSSFTGKDR